MSDNLVTQILKSHLREGELTAGAQVTVDVDQTLFSDLTSIMAGQTIMALEEDRFRAEKTVFYCDHNVICAVSENADAFQFMKTVSAKYGAYFSKPGNGVCHFLHCQRFAEPGKILLGADSHTPTSGALGMIAIGSGGLTVTKAALGQGFRLVTPKVLGVHLTGRHKPDVAPKDIALELMRRMTVKGCIGYMVEYFGDTLETLTVPDRQTICNMSIEMGATCGVFPSDEQTRIFLEAQGRGDCFRPMAAEEGCAYDQIVEIDCAALEPLVACPSMPDNVTTVRGQESVKPESVFIGSCTNASYSDIARAAAIFKGHKVHPDIDCTVGPGSKQVLEQLIADGILTDLIESGCRILECACGPCIGIGQVPSDQAVTVRTSNRNFPGRSGNNTAVVYLSSPETAAATALMGHLADPRDVCDCSILAEITEPLSYPVDDSMIIKPEDIADPAAVTVKMGPNISTLPMRDLLPETIDAKVVLKLGNNITTDDIIPGGSSILKYISNYPKFAEFTFCYTDPGFVDRCREYKRSVIVGGSNYGQGSSREHAAMLPMMLGVEAVLTKSYARIHKENLFNYGILPLQFANEEDYEKISDADELQIADVYEGIRSGSFTVINKTTGITIPAVLIASEKDKAMLLAGGALRDLKNKLQQA
ncbi:MAG: aconitate hydratase [Mogibacterium sp.]|nr:aconitate hydratase [Mogibacterium sp.]